MPTTPAVRVASVKSNTTSSTFASVSLASPVSLVAGVTTAAGHSPTVRVASVRATAGVAGSVTLLEPVTLGGNVYNASIHLYSPVTFTSRLVSASARLANVQQFTVQNNFIWNGSSWVSPPATFMTEPMSLSATTFQAGSGAALSEPMSLGSSVNNISSITTTFLASPVQLASPSVTTSTPRSATGSLTFSSNAIVSPGFIAVGSINLQAVGSGSPKANASMASFLVFTAGAASQAQANSLLRSFLTFDGRSLGGIGGSQNASGHGALALLAKGKAFPTPVSAVGIPRYIKSGTTLVRVSSYVRVHGNTHAKIYQTGKTAPKNR